MLLTLVAATPALAQEAPASRSGSVLNILLLAGIAYFLIRMFRRRSGNDKGRPDRWSRPDSDVDRGADEVERPELKTMDRHEAARQAWSMLSSEGNAKAAPASAPAAPPELGDGFNEAEFLEGAKIFFSRFQQSVGEQDFQAIRDFMSDEIYAAATTGTGRERTEIMLVSAKLMEMKSDGNRTVASVFYDAQLRVGDTGRPVQLRTVWEFSRDDGVPNGLWVLEKINSIDQ
ncbi:TIM44-like domain-containing protein [Pseudodesulfovibrio sp. S3-i]|nr:TIM44-like domain-containing protein [Pseudodesulfovibrio sp. S3-i]